MTVTTPAPPTPSPAPDAVGGPCTDRAGATLSVSVRELRLMTGRVLLTTALPFGTVAAARDVVVVAETHGLKGPAGLLAALPCRRRRGAGRWRRCRAERGGPVREASRRARGSAGVFPRSSKRVSRGCREGLGCDATHRRQITSYPGS
ncbi:hypothetical protein JCM12681A_66050 [Streptomyces mexicanus]